MDYYKVLECKRDCTDADIKKNYRRLAIQWHPKRGESEGKDEELVAAKFREISESYWILQNPKLRAIFDQYGEKGLKNGLPNGKGGYVGAWSYNNNPDEQFAEFFGSFSPFADFFNEEGGYARLFTTSSGTAGGKLEAQIVNLYCSLEELHSGCTKRQRVTRQKISADGTNTEADTKIMTIEVQPGWREGTKITFTCEGDEAPETTTGKPDSWPLLISVFLGR
jgi:DnaJ family protein B protein 13